MAGPQRKCANCRFYSDAGLAGNGWCTHPKRKQTSGLKLLVRAGELACRDSWHRDLFESRLDDTAGTGAAADPQDQDDEVTSVAIPAARPPAPEDRIVNDRYAAPRHIADTNDAAQRDQEERARILARGSRAALAQARRRFSERRLGPAAEGDVVASDSTLSHEADRVIARQARFSDRGTASPGPPHLTTEPVPREEVAQRGGRPIDRFDTVPEVDPDFDLPSQRHRQAPAPPPESAAPTDESHLSTLEDVRQRARRTRAAKQRLRPIRRTDLLAGRDAGPASRGELPQHEPEPAEPDRYEDAFTAIEPAVRRHYVEPVGAGAADDGWDDLDDARDAEDDLPATPRPRRQTWWNRFGFGQRTPGLAHDEATVTRHAAQPAWLDEPAEDPEPVRERLQPAGATSRPEDIDRPDRPAAQRAAPSVEAHPAPQPAPWPDRGADRRRAATDLERPTPPARHLARLTGELPDLDDALFDGAREAAARADRRHHDRQEPHDAAPPRTAVDMLRSSSPRDSYFRAYHFRQQESLATTPDHAAEPAVAVDDAILPDLDDGHLDVRDAVARGSQLMDRRIAVAPDIPRRCRTCRSFRSADGGTRGWCTNEWAFTHRRMVNDDDLACVSAIGCWWLPADDLRLDLDDETDNTPTPRMDRLIAGDRPAARRVAGE